MSDINGELTLTATANATAGAPYTVTASIESPTGPRTMTFPLTNEAPSPTLTVTGQGTVSAPASSGVLVFTGTIVASDPSGSFAGDVLTVTITAGAGPADLLGSTDTHQGTVEVKGVVVGTITGGSHGSPLVITFNASATAAQVEATVGSVAYVADFSHTSGVTIAATLSNGGGSSAAATSAVTVTPPAPGSGGVYVLPQPVFVPGTQSSSGCEVAPGGQGDPRSLVALGALLALVVVARRRARVVA